MTRVLYTVDMGMSTRKVDSWCMSRLGGSPARATRNTPPFCGFSSARAAGTAHSPTTSTTLSISPSMFLHPIATPPVCELHERLALRPPQRYASQVLKGIRQGLHHADSGRVTNQSNVGGTGSA